MDQNMKEELEAKRNEALEELEKMHSEKSFTINDREYKITKLTHQFRLQVIAVYSKIEAKMTMMDYSFVIDKNFTDLMKKVDERILFEDALISKIPNHFDTYEEDYLDYVAVSLKVICYPLYKTKLHID
jgi:hypothetical protein